MNAFLGAAAFALIVFFATVAVTGVFGPQLPVARPHTGRHGHGDRLDDFSALVRITWLYATLRLRPAMRLAEEERPAPADPLPGRDAPPAVYPRPDGAIHVGRRGKLTIIPAAGLYPYPSGARTETDMATVPDGPPVTAPIPALTEPANPARGYAPPADWTPYLPAPIGAPE